MTRKKNFFFAALGFELRVFHFEAGVLSLELHLHTKSGCSVLFFVPISNI
jgi:hypothetical protein